MTKLWMTCGAAAALLLVSCGGSKEEAKKEDTAAPAAAPAAAVDDANAATVTGKVTFAGTKPTPRTIDMSANPICARAHTTAQKSEEAIVNDNGTLRNTFVWIKSGLPDKQWPVPTTTVSLEQDGCMYKPHVIGVMAGQGIEIKNDDATNHNIHPLLCSRRGDDSGEVQRASVDARLHRSGFAPIFCRDRRRRDVYNKRIASGDVYA